MQWICLAERPLSLTELRFALVAELCNSSSPPLRCEDVNDFIELDNRMKKQVTSLSGGLAEVKHQKFGTIVQFIHQSVNDYLLSKGLKFLISATEDIGTQASTQPDSSSTGSVIGKSQHRLTKTCINYLKLEEVVQILRRLSFYKNSFRLLVTQPSFNSCMQRKLRAMVFFRPILRKNLVLQSKHLKSGL